MSVFPGNSPVVIYVNGSAQTHSAPDAPGHSLGQSSGSAQPYDPYKVHREFPERWRAYIRANFRNLAHVTQVFGVSERTARKWWDGDNGANGGHVAVAMREHPIEAPRMLFAAE